MRTTDIKITNGRWSHPPVCPPLSVGCIIKHASSHSACKLSAFHNTLSIWRKKNKTEQNLTRKETPLSIYLTIAERFVFQIIVELQTKALAMANSRK